MQALLGLAGVRPGETRRTVLLVAWSMAVVGGVIITGGLAGRSLFLSNLPREAIALKFLLPPLALVASVSAYTRIMDRFARDRLVAATSVGFAAIVLAARALYEAPFGEGLVFLSLLFALLEVIGALAIIQFWTVAGDLFDAREAKRLFPLVAAGGTAAAVLFAGALGGAARHLPPADLLFVVAGALLVCGAAARTLGRAHPEAFAPAAGAEVSSVSAGVQAAGRMAELRSLLEPPLVRAIAGIMIAGAVASAVADYQLDLALQARYGEDGSGMVFFLGALRAGAGVAALAIQLTLAGRLLRRFGLRGGLLALPVLMAAGQVAILLTGGALLAVAVPKAADGALKFDLNNTTVNLLYLPVSSRLRGRLKAVLDGILKPALLSLLGLVFLAAGMLPQVTAVHWAGPALAAGALWLWFVRRAALAYIDALGASIRQRRLSGDMHPIVLGDETSRRVLLETLAAPDPALVLQALDLVGEAPEVDWTPHLLPLLSRPEADIRVGTLHALVATGVPGLIERYTSLLAEDPAPEVRAAALEALAAAGGPEVADKVLPHLASRAPRVRAAAVRASLLHLGLEGMLHAGVALKGLFDDEDPELRAEGAVLLGDLGARSFFGPLVDLLADGDERVRRAAVEAARQLAAPQLIPSLIPLLETGRLASRARVAISACLDGDAALLAAALADPARPPAVRAQLVECLTGCEDEGRAQLEEALLSPEGPIRGAAARALSGTTVDEATIERALEIEAASACRLARLAAALQTDERAVHVEPALRNRLEQAGDRALSLLALGSPGLPIDSVRRSVHSADKRARANALELLENVIEPARRAAALAVVSGDVSELVLLGRSRGESAPPPADDALLEILRSEDQWLRVCGLFAVGLDPAPGTAALALVEVAIHDAAALVAETALWARAQVAGVPALGGPNRMPLTTLEKVLFLKSVPLFAGLAGEAIAAIAPIAREVRCEPGEVFIREGEDGDCLYVIVDGEAEARKHGEPVGRLQSRSIIGEVAVLTDKSRNADCVAVGSLLMLRIGKADFWALLEARPELSTAVLRTIVDRYV